MRSYKQYKKWYNGLQVVRIASGTEYYTLRLANFTTQKDEQFEGYSVNEATTNSIGQHCQAFLRDALCHQEWISHVWLEYSKQHLKPCK